MRTHTSELQQAHEPDQTRSDFAGERSQQRSASPPPATESNRHVEESSQEPDQTQRSASPQPAEVDLEDQLSRTGASSAVPSVSADKAPESSSGADYFALHDGCPSCLRSNSGHDADQSDADQGYALERKLSDFANEQFPLDDANAGASRIPDDSTAVARDDPLDRPVVGDRPAESLGHAPRAEPEVGSAEGTAATAAARDGLLDSFVGEGLPGADQIPLWPSQETYEYYGVPASGARVLWLHASRAKSPEMLTCNGIGCDEWSIVSPRLAPTGPWYCSSCKAAEADEAERKRHAELAKKAEEEEKAASYKIRQNFIWYVRNERKRKAPAEQKAQDEAAAAAAKKKKKRDAEAAEAERKRQAEQQALAEQKAQDEAAEAKKKEEEEKRDAEAAEAERKCQAEQALAEQATAANKAAAAAVAKKAEEEKAAERKSQAPAEQKAQDEAAAEPRRSKRHAPAGAREEEKKKTKKAAEAAEAAAEPRRSKRHAPAGAREREKKKRV